VVRAVAEEVGIAEVIAEVLPADTVDAVKWLQAARSRAAARCAGWRAQAHRTLINSRNAAARRPHTPRQPDTLFTPYGSTGGVART